MSEDKKIMDGITAITDESLDLVSGGVTNPLEASDQYLIETLGLTDQQAQNMTSAGTFSRSFYVAKLNETQRAEYESLIDEKVKKA